MYINKYFMVIECCRHLFFVISKLKTFSRLFASMNKQDIQLTQTANKNKTRIYYFIKSRTNKVCGIFIKREIYKSSNNKIKARLM